jgi:hypothetical protein
MCHRRQEVQASRHIRTLNATLLLTVAHTVLALSQRTIPSGTRKNNTAVARRKVATRLAGSIYRRDNILEASLPLFLFLFAKEGWLVLWNQGSFLQEGFAFCLLASPKGTPAVSATVLYEIVCCFSSVQGDPWQKKLGFRRTDQTSEGSRERKERCIRCFQ